LVRWPGVVKPGSVSQTMVANVDFAETLLDAAGVAVPADMQGRSIVPILKGESPADWRNSFYYHYYEFPGPHAVRRHYGVIDRRYKLVNFYEPDVAEWEMFDLEADPKEMTSVFNDPKYAAERTRLEKELTRLRKELGVPDHDPPHTLRGPNRPGQGKAGQGKAGQAKAAAKKPDES